MAFVIRNFSLTISPSEWKLVDANRDLIARMEVKIKAKLAEVWGEK